MQKTKKIYVSVTRSSHGVILTWLQVPRKNACACSDLQTFSSSVSTYNKTIFHRKTYLLDQGDCFPKRVSIVDAFIFFGTVVIIAAIAVII
jgi:hypothetical protein